MQMTLQPFTGKTVHPRSGEFIFEQCNAVSPEEAILSLNDNRFGHTYEVAAGTPKEALAAYFAEIPEGETIQVTAKLVANVSITGEIELDLKAGDDLMELVTQVIRGDDVPGCEEGVWWDEDDVSCAMPLDIELYGLRAESETISVHSFLGASQVTLNTNIDIPDAGDTWKRGLAPQLGDGLEALLRAVETGEGLAEAVDRARELLNDRPPASP